MPGDLSFDLHVLIALLDRSADRLLREANGLSYRRFRAMVSVDRLSGADRAGCTQRAVAADLGVSEPSASRMTGVLVDAGLVEARRDPDGGNRRRLRLTPAGQTLLEQCTALLEQRFERLVEHCGISYTDYARDTATLLTALADG